MCSICSHLANEFEVICCYNKRTFIVDKLYSNFFNSSDKWREVLSHSNKCLLKLYVTYFHNLEKNTNTTTTTKPKSFFSLPDNQLKVSIIIDKRMLLSRLYVHFQNPRFPFIFITHLKVLYDLFFKCRQINTTWIKSMM